MLALQLQRCRSAGAQCTPRQSFPFWKCPSAKVQDYAQLEARQAEQESTGALRTRHCRTIAVPNNILRRQHTPLT